MSDRRRTQRFVLGPPLPADAMSLQDVVVERIVGDRVTIVSLTAHEPGEETVIQVPTSAGMTRHRTTVLSSTPIAVGASVQFRVALQMHDAAGEGPVS